MASSISPGFVLVQQRADINAQADRLPVDEFLARIVLQGVEEEVVGAFDMPRIPAGVVECRSAPAIGLSSARESPSR